MPKSKKRKSAKKYIKPKKGQRMPPKIGFLMSFASAMEASRREDMRIRMEKEEALRLAMDQAQNPREGEV